MGEDDMREKVTGCLLLCFVVLHIGVLFGCGEREEKDAKELSFVIGVVTKSRNSEYWMSVCSGMEKAADEMRAEVIILSPDSETNEEIQKKMIEDLMKKQINALAVSPINSYHNSEYIERAEEDGIAVYSYDTPIADYDVPYIGVDNEKVGYELAEVIAKRMNYQGNVGVVSGDFNQLSHQRRMKGFQEYISAQPDMRIAFVRSGYSNLRISEGEVQKLQEEYPDVQAIMSTSAVTALGIMEAYKERPLYIASIDAQEDAIDAVKDGGMTALAAQSGYDIGYETIRYIMEDEQGIQKKEDKILEAEILTQDNVGTYEEQKK